MSNVERTPIYSEGNQIIGYRDAREETAADTPPSVAASNVTVSADGFAGNLSPADTTVQAALATIDGLSLGGGGPSTTFITPTSVAIDNTINGSIVLRVPFAAPADANNHLDEFVMLLAGGLSGSYTIRVYRVPTGSIDPNGEGELLIPTFTGTAGTAMTTLKFSQLRQAPDSGFYTTFAMQDINNGWTAWSGQYPPAPLADNVGFDIVVCMTLSSGSDLGSIFGGAIRTT